MKPSPSVRGIRGLTWAMRIFECCAAARATSTEVPIEQ